MLDSLNLCPQKSQAREVEQLAQVMEEAASSSGGWSGSLDWIAPTAGQPAPMELLNGCWRLLYTSGFNNGERDWWRATEQRQGVLSLAVLLAVLCVSNLAVEGQPSLLCDSYLGRQEKECGVAVCQKLFIFSRFSVLLDWAQPGGGQWHPQDSITSDFFGNNSCWSCWEPGCLVSHVTRLSVTDSVMSPYTLV